MNWLLKRISEPSSIYALILVALSFMTTLTDEQHAALVMLASAIFATPDKQHA